jgi:hypothetical protein
MSRDVLNEVKKSVENPLLVDWARRVQESMKKNKPLSQFFDSLRRAMEKSGSTISSTRQAQTLRAQQQQMQQTKIQQEKAAAVNPALTFLANRFLQEMDALEKKNNPLQHRHLKPNPDKMLTDLERELLEHKPDAVLGDHVEEDLKRLRETEHPSPHVADKFNFTLDRNKSFNVPTPAPMDAQVVNYLETKAIEIAQTVYQKMEIEGPDAGPKKGPPTPFNMKMDPYN